MLFIRISLILTLFFNTFRTIVGLIKEVIMRGKISSTLVLFLITIFSLESLSGKKIPVMGDNQGIHVSMTGTAKKIVESTETNSTVLYYLQQKGKKPIKVHSPYQKPEIGVKYNISGVLYTDREDGKKFISEKTRKVVTQNDKYKYKDGEVSGKHSKIGNQIMDLKQNVSKYEKEYIKISGEVVEHYNDEWYRIKGKYGTTLDVQSYNNRLPALKSKVNKAGVLYIDADGNPYLSELPGMVIEKTKILEEKARNNTNLVLYTVIGMIVVGAIGIGFVTYIRNNVEGSKSKSGSGIQSQVITDYENGYEEPEPAQSEEKLYEEDNTLALSTPEKTAKILPGRLTIISDAPDKGETFPISGTPTPEGYTATIGKAKSCDITIANRPEYSTVSREHAMFIEQDGNVWIKNLSSTNPIIVNEEKYDTDKKVELKNGDKIKLGLLELLFENSIA